MSVCRKSLADVTPRGDRLLLETSLALGKPLAQQLLRDATLMLGADGHLPLRESAGFVSNSGEAQVPKATHPTGPLRTLPIEIRGAGCHGPTAERSQGLPTNANIS